MTNLLRHFIRHTRLALSAALLAACPALPATADDLIIFNPSTYMTDGRLVLTPTPNMIVWDGGIATRAGSVWVGNGWERYPGGRGALTTRMLRATEEPEPVVKPRIRIRTDCCQGCDCQLLMWRSWP